MKRLVYIGHSYHQKTRSADFFIEGLQSRFDVTIIWDESWKDKSAPTFVEQANRLEPDIVVVFQVLKEPQYLSLLACPKVLLVPMYDECGHWPFARWRGYSNFQFLSFSRTLHQRLSWLGIASQLLVFYPNPTTIPMRDPTDEFRIFFWERTKKITWEQVRRFAQEFPEAKIHLHRAPDPQHHPKPLDPLDLASGRISVTEWFTDPREYREHVSQSLIYIAPRTREGIGMSFLEAMALGCVVVAEDAPTMNEYIKNGKNGILVHWSTQPTLKKTYNFKKIAAASRHSVELGYREYSQQFERILDDLANPHWSSSRRTFGWYASYFEPQYLRLRQRLASFSQLVGRVLRRLRILSK